MLKQITAIISREDDGYVSLCPELDIASQGETIEDARENLQEALELFFETASSEEIKTHMRAFSSSKSSNYHSSRISC